MSRFAIRNPYFIVVASLIVIVVGLITYGYVDQKYLQSRRPVARVGSVSIPVGEWQARVRMERTRLINQLTLYQQYSQYFGMDLSSQEQQIAAQLNDSTTIGQTVVDEMIDEELILFSEQDQGLTVDRLPAPPERAEEIREARRMVIEAAADFDDAILTDYLEGNPIEGERLKAALARGTIQCRIFPVLLGSALRNKGVQPLLDAVAAFLPSPLQTPPLFGTGTKGGTPEPIPCDPKAPLCALAFKVTSEEGKKLTYLRIYAGTLQAGMQAFNVTRSCHERINQLFRMHAHKRERIESAQFFQLLQEQVASRCATTV